MYIPIYRPQVWDAEALQFPLQYESPQLDAVSSVTITTFGEGRRLPSEDILVRVEATLDVEFDVFIFKGDYYILDDNPDLSVWDHDWNNHYVAASTSVSMEGRFLDAVYASDGIATRPPNDAR